MKVDGSCVIGPEDATTKVTKFLIHATVMELLNEYLDLRPLNS